MVVYLRISNQPWFLNIIPNIGTLKTSLKSIFPCCWRTARWRKSYIMVSKLCPKNHRPWAISYYPASLHPKLVPEIGCYIGDCRSYSFAIQTNYFKHFDKTKSYPIKQYINCNSTYVVYKIWCSACNKIYIGCTCRKLRVRTLEHLNNMSNPANKNNSYIARHFIETRPPRFKPRFGWI